MVQIKDNVVMEWVKIENNFTPLLPPVNLNSIIMTNSFLDNIPILYPLKTPTTFWCLLFGVFRGYEIGTLTRNRLKKNLNFKWF